LHVAPPRRHRSSGEAPGLRRSGGGPPHLHSPGEAPGLRRSGGGPPHLHSPGEAPGLRRGGGGPPHLHSPGEAPGLRRGGGGPPHLHHTAVEAHRISTIPRWRPTAVPPGGARSLAPEGVSEARPPGAREKPDSFRPGAAGRLGVGDREPMAGPPPDRRTAVGQDGEGWEGRGGLGPSGIGSLIGILLSPRPFLKISRKIRRGWSGADEDLYRRLHCAGRQEALEEVGSCRLLRQFDAIDAIGGTLLFHRIRQIVERVRRPGGAVAMAFIPCCEPAG
jgi:hypothetical protein